MGLTTEAEAAQPRGLSVRVLMERCDDVLDIQLIERLEHEAIAIESNRVAIENVFDHPADLRELAPGKRSVSFKLCGL